jgi:hypothetical protein
MIWKRSLKEEKKIISHTTNQLYAKTKKVRRGLEEDKKEKRGDWMGIYFEETIY